MVAELTGLDIANSSLLDEATAAAEAMAWHAGSPGPARCASSCTTTCTRRRWPCCAPGPNRPESSSSWATSTCSTTSTGCSVRCSATRPRPEPCVDWSGAIDRVHELGAQAIVATDLLACVLLRSPGDLGADIAVGSAQRFGVPMGYGGPHAGFIAVRESATRALPGGWSASAPTPPDARRSASRSRPGSSTSGVRRRRPTSARRRSCSRTSPGSTPRGTVRTACVASPGGCTRSRPRPRRRSRRRAPPPS
jgi:glycine dehydrogenase